MYQLFNLPSSVNLGIITNPEWNLIRSGLLYNLNNVVDYYRTNTFTAPIETVLVSIINALGEGSELSDTDYYNWLERNTLSVSQSLGLTSSAARGKIFRNQFYGPGVNEILISQNESFDYRKALANWRDITAVKVLCHPFSDLSIPILNTKVYGGSGYAVIAINIPKLLMQYRGFRAFEKRNREGSLPTHAFIHKFVLPNICASHLDYALFNRFYRLYFNLDQTKLTYKHPFYWTDWSKRVDVIYQQMKEVILTRHLHFNQVLKQIPLAKMETALDLSYLPSFYRSRQVNWALAISRLEVLELLLENNFVTKGDWNRSAINSVQRHIGFYTNDQVFNHMLPRDQAVKVNDRFKRLLGY
ncbi:MAG: hypothetical protein M0R77_00865 [Gammaproteobacteria bacterium]|nr:hypothetical protein [Acholeplasmataceae bacterium]MCK9529106.1 hypothetical protein [Gammaproteobacteria bacterium]